MSDYINYNFFLLEVADTRRPKNKLQEELVDFIEDYHRMVLPFDTKISFISYIEGIAEKLNKKYPHTNSVNVSISTENNNDVHFYFYAKLQDAFLMLKLKAFSMKNSAEMKMLVNKAKISTSDNE